MGETAVFPLKPLGEVVEILDYLRRPVNSSDRSNRVGSYPYFGANGQVGCIDDYIFDEDLVLVAEDGGFFFDDFKPISYRIAGKAWVNNHAHVLRPKAGIDVDWLNYSIAYQDVRHLINGTTRAKLNQRELREIQIPVPAPEEQARIKAKIVDCISRLEEVSALQEASEIEKTHLLRSYLNEAELSSGWPKKKVEDLIVDSRNGRSIKSTSDQGDGRVLTLSSVRGITLDFSAAKTVSFDDRIAATYKIQQGDVFVSRSNTIDLVGLSATAETNPEGRVVFPDLLIRLKPNLAKVRPDFLSVALRFPSCRKQLQSFAKGTSQSMVKISGAELRQVDLPCPGLAEQESFIHHLEELRAVVDGLTDLADNTALGALRVSILRQAFAGEL